MNSIDEKLKHFDELILKDAAQERNLILQKIRNRTEETVSRKKSEFKERADSALKKETAAAKREENNQISKAVIEGKQMLMGAREEIMKSVLDNTRDNLCRFTAGGEYFPYLVQQLKESCSQAGDGNLVAYISNSDLMRFVGQLETLKKELPAGIVIKGLDDDIIGGCRVFNESGNVLVDNTLSKKLALSADHFIEICKLRID